MIAALILSPVLVGWLFLSPVVGLWVGFATFATWFTTINFYGREAS